MARSLRFKSTSGRIIIVDATHVTHVSEGGDREEREGGLELTYIHIIGGTTVIVQGTADEIASMIWGNTGQ